MIKRREICSGNNERNTRKGNEIPRAKFQDPNSKTQIPNTKFQGGKTEILLLKTLNPSSKFPGTERSGFGSLKFGPWNLDLGIWDLDLHSWNLVFGIWNLDLYAMCELYNEIQKLCNTFGYGCFHLCRVIYREKGLNTRDCLKA